MNTKRLTTLIKFMDSLPRSANKHFSMGHWFTHHGENHHDLQFGQALSKKELHLCGTSACALGWGCTIPSFKKAGLQLVHDGGIGEVRYLNYIDGMAAATFFEIETLQMDALFGGHNEDRTPKAWAKRAKKLMRKWA